MTDKHKRITQTQYDIWIDDPTTKTYLQCLKWSAEQIAESLGNGAGIDTSNNDLSMNQISTAMGKKSGFIEASGWSVNDNNIESFNPKPVFTIHKLLEEEEDNDTSTDHARS